MSLPIRMAAVVLRSFLFPLILLCAAVYAPAADASWLRIETENFDVLGDADESEIRSVAERLERFRTAVAGVIAIRPSGVKTRVVVFRDDASFRPFKPKRADGTPDDLVAGLFQPGEDVNYIAVPAGGADLSTIYHEYAHDILNANFGRAHIPAWLNEGFAEYFQTFRTAEDGAAFVGAAPRTHLNLLRRGPLIPWDEFFAVDNYSLQERGAHSRTLFYAQAWAAVRVLLETASGPGGTVDPDDVQRLARKIERERLDEGVRTLIAKPDLLGRKVSGPIAAGPGAGAAPRALSGVEANAYLGDLLYHLKDLSAAERYLKAALAEEPKMPAANASLGMVRLRQRRFAEAKRHLETAIDGDAGNFLVHFYHAYLLTRENMDAGGMVSSFPAETARKIRETLRRSIKLNDRFAENYRLLAFTALVTNEELDEALSSLRRAENLRPGDTEMSLMVPQILLRQEKAPEAWAAADAVFKSTEDVRVRKEAEGLMKAADQLSKGMQENKVVLAYARPPVIYQRKDLTDEQYARIERDREINNVNLLIDRPRAGEKLAIGRLGRVACIEDRIVYDFKSTSGELRLSGRRFDDLKLKVLIEGTRSFSFRCDATVTDELAAVVYRPRGGSPAGLDGELISVSFVPAHFELRSLEQVAAAPQVIVQGGAATRLEENEKAAAADREEMERVMRETRMRDIAGRLRPLGPGERRVIGTPERVACSAGKMLLTVRLRSGMGLFAAASTADLEVASFNPDSGIVEVGCRSQMPPLPAVITYRQNGDDRELVAVEFVPSFFELPTE